MLNDVRLAVRSLRGSGTTLAALLVLALGIGSSTAIYAIVDAVLLRPLPFDNPEQLVAIVEAAPERAESATQGLTTSQSFLDWRLRARSFDGMAAVASWPSRIGGAGPPFEVRALRTSHELFQVLRVTQAAGRLFQPEDEKPGSERVAVVDHAFWETRLGSSPTAVGSRITVDGEPRTIVGVLPPGFAFPLDGAGPAGIVVAATFTPDDRIRGTSESHRWRVIGRLRRHHTVDGAGQEMAAIWTALRNDNPGWSEGHRLRVLPLDAQVIAGTRGTLQLLFAGVGAVLLLTFGNIGLWMLARASARDIEWSIRAAIGASHWRLARAMALEGLLVGLAGAAAGVFVAHLISSVLLATLPPGLPRAAAIGVDARVLAVTGVVSALLGAASGTLAAVAAMHTDLARKLTTGDRTAGPHATGARRLLIVGEIALATMVLSAAGLFIASFRAVMSVDLGVQYDDVLTVHIVPADAETAMTPDEASTAARLRLRRDLDVVRRLPDVTAVGAVQGGLPLSGDRTGVRIQAHDGTSRVDGTADRRIATPGYFDALDMRLIAGRWISDADIPGAPAVALLNEAAARRYWPDRDAVGARVQVGTGGEMRTVIGVVADVRTLGPEVPAPPELYVPAAQAPIAPDTLVIRTEPGATGAAAAIRDALQRTDPDASLAGGVIPLSTQMNRFVGARRFVMFVLALFAAVALTVAGLGTYSVMAFTVGRRTREIGVRQALGATHGAILLMVVAETARLAAIGAALGLGAALLAGASIRPFLFHVEPTDPRILALATLTLAAAALLAAIVPAVRATRVDPTVALH